MRAPEAKQKKLTPWYADFRFFTILFLILTAFLLMSIFGGSHSAGPGGGLGPFATGKEAPDIEVETLSGTQWRLSDLKGKVVFLNFWATWCPPCRREIPSLQSLYKKYLSQPDFVVAAVACDETGKEDVAPYIEKNAITFPVYLDSQMKAAAAYGVAGFPETFLIDRQGKIAHKFVGPRNWEDSRFRRLVDELLAQPASD